jgi:serine/threonine protein kinase
MDKKDIIFSFEPLWESWKITDCIGQGSFGKVYKIEKECYQQKHYSAVKIITIPTDEEYINITDSIGNNEKNIEAYMEKYVNKISNEISLLYNLKGHSNIISYEDYKKIKSESKFN